MIRSSRVVLFVLLAVLVAVPATADPLSDALAALRKEDYATALRLLRPLADNGSAEAQFGLGMMYRYGEGVPRDDVEGAKWLLRAAEQGHDGAQFFVGSSYLLGRGVPEDPVEGAKWMRRAAEQGKAAAQNDLAMFYSAGVSRDYVQAYLWFHLASTRFDPSDTQRIKIALFGRDEMASRMTPEQIAEAQRLAREWKPKPEKQGKK